MDDTETREELHKSIQQHITAEYGPEVVTDWLLCAEVVDGDDNRMLYLGMSESSSAWKIRGMSYHLAKMVHELTA